MNTLNAVLVKVIGLVLAPLASWPAQVALIIISLLAGVLAAIAFRYTSPQQRLKRVADQVRASLLAIRLFKDDLRSIFAAQGTLFKASGLRLIYSLPPLAVLIVPFVLLMAQLAMWYEFQPLTAGQSVLVEVVVRPDAWDQKYSDLKLVAPEQVTVDGPVRDVQQHTITWRLSVAEAPPSDVHTRLLFEHGGTTVAEKQLVIGADAAVDRLVFVSPVRPGPDPFDRLLYPGEPAFDAASPIQRIAIDYPPRENRVFGWRVHWLVTFLVVSILGALAIKPIVKVQF